MDELNLAHVVGAGPALPLIPDGHSVRFSVPRSVAWASEEGSMAMAPESQAVTQARREKLAREQGVSPVEDPTTLLGDFWPEDETADEFIAAVQAWRRGEDSPQPQ
jgi:hypothetical protein